MDTLLALSPVDGRYQETCRVLTPYLSEYALIKYRAVVMIEHLIALSEHPQIPVRAFSQSAKLEMRKLSNMSLEQAKVIKLIETKGWKHIPRTNHDVKAVELWLRGVFKRTLYEDIIEWLHFGRTSEDVNNIAYGLMLREAVRKVLLPTIAEVASRINDMAKRHAETPMLARTHGQPATPTTLGKELNVFSQRLMRQIDQLKHFHLLVKVNGASGNYCADVAALPHIEWLQFSRDFVRTLNEDEGGALQFECNFVTTQIEPHDTYAELFAIFMRVNTILVGFCQDIWRYVSDEWLVQKPAEGEIGSSTMPHKVNPIEFENAEANLPVANALMECFCRKLPISRLQRDLSDSSVERNFGVAFGHSLIAYTAVLRGLGKISANEQKLRDALDARPEVLAEAIQTILRREGVSEGYNLLKDLSRGKAVSAVDLLAFIQSLPVSEAVKQELLLLKPSTYIGLAPMLARM